MIPSLAQLYKRLLFTYPAEYRRAREAEMLATLLDASVPGQTLPSPRETAGLILGGLRTRARLGASSGPSAVWAEALRLGAALVVTSYMVGTVILSVFPGSGYLRGRLLPLVLAATVVALLRRPRRLGLALVAVDLFFAWPLQAYDVLHGTVGLAVSWFAIGPLPLGLAAAVFAWYPGARPASRPWPVWIIALVVLLPAGLEFSTYNGAYLGMEAFLHLHVPVSLFVLVLPAIALAGLSLLMRNPAPALAASIYLASFLGGMTYLLAFTSYYDPVMGLAAGLVVGCVAAAGLSRRALALA
ncbi:MAG TPA: hypothetical protein VIA06_17265 [Candidatus Dormibacteraeota bacterium]|jgi:hypothetical protein|nr:hypothetical protein [Candidatus Dormibacteraeota bacterium]